MKFPSADIRCKHCGRLLARRESDGLALRRGDMQALVSGDYQVALTCSRCRSLNMVTGRKAG